MNTVPLASERPEAPLFCDGLGERVVAADGATGELLQILRVRPALTAVPSFEFALRERSARLANFRHAYYARVRRIDRVQVPAPGLAIVSDHIEGTRLSDILRVASERRLQLDINTALCLIRQLVPAVALLHENAREVSHGLIAPERLIVTPHARLVIVEHVLGAAVEQLQFSRERLWQEFRVALPSSAGMPRFDHRADVTAVGLVALALVLGRPLRADEYPHQIPALLSGARERTALGEEQPLSTPLRDWLARALQLDTRRAFASAPEALSVLEDVVADESTYVAAPVALETFMSRYIAALLEPAAIETAPAPVATPAAAVPVPVASSPVMPAPLTPPVAPVAARAVPPMPLAPVASSVPLEPIAAPPTAPAPPTLSGVPRREPMAAPRREPIPPPPAHPLSPVRPPQAATAVPSVPPVHVAPPPAAEPVRPVAPMPPAAPPPAVSQQLPPLSARIPPPPEFKPAVAPMPVPQSTPVAPKIEARVEPPLPPVRDITELIAADDLRRGGEPAGPIAFGEEYDAVAPAPVAKIEKEKKKKPRSRFSAKTAGAVAAVVAALAGAAYYGARRPVTAVDSTMGTLDVQSSPAGVQVFIDGENRGQTPARLSLKPGAHILELRGRGVPRVIPVNVAAGGQVSQYLEFADTPSTGQLQVQSQPAGARVSVDGVDRGVAPLTVASLSPGDHEVVLKSDAGTARQVVSVQAGATASLVAPVTGGESTAGPVSGWVSVAAPVSVEIREGGKLLGTSDADRLMLAAGKHELEIGNEMLGYRVTRVVQVPPGKVAPIKIDLPNGVVNLNASPWAEVWIDGKRVGETPIGNLSVPIGPHEVVFKNPQLGEKRHVISVSLAAPVRVSIDMK